MLTLHNISVYGFSESNLSVVMDESVIIWIGSSDRYSKADFAGSVEIDGKGAWLATGFIDNHIHLSATGFAQQTSYLASVTSNAELNGAISTHAPDSGHIYFGHGWENSGWSPSIIDIPFPAYASRVDAHSGVVSQALIDLIPDIKALDGFSNDGYLTGNAHGFARSFVEGRLTNSQRATAIDQAITALFAQGIVSVHEMSGPTISSQDDAQRVLEVSQRRGMKTFLWWGELQGFDTARELGAYGCGGDLFVDGSFGSRTALISKPFEAGSSGIAYLSIDEIREHILRATECAMPIGFHAIGDQAVESIAVALEELRPHIDRIRALDFRIEHAEYVSDSALKVFNEFAVCFSVQPHFDALWGSENGMYAERLGERYAQLNRFSDYQTLGIPQVFGSDSPVTSFNPWSSIRASINMHNSSSSLSSRAAFRAHTTQGWRQVGDERSHALQVGAPADVALWKVENFSYQPAPDVVSRWSTDSRSGISPLPDVTNALPECLLTITGGEIRYQASELS